MKTHWLTRFAVLILAEGSAAWRFAVRYNAHLQWGVFYITLAVYPLFCAASWLRLGWKRATGAKPTSIWGPTPIINIAENSALLKKAGYQSDTVVYTTYFITDGFDYNLEKVTANAALAGWFPNLLFLWALLKYDIFHVFYDGGLWSGMKIVPRALWLELPLLRLAGKKIVAMAFGADVRTRTRNELWQPWNICAECPEPSKHCICNDHAAAINIKHHRDWCNEMIAMGDMHDFVFGSRPDFVHWPIDLDAVGPVPEVTPSPAGRLRIAHSPNHRNFKGTRFIEAAVEDLRARRVDVELDIIERVPNNEARRRYAAADVIVPQCIAGWIGFTEIEGMALGKPVLTYIRDSEKYLSHVPGWPALNAPPDRIADVLVELAADPEKRLEIGRRSRKYVEEHWSVAASSPKFIALTEAVWRGDGLGRALARKCADLRYGEERAKPADPGGQTFPVSTNGTLFLDRLDWGLFGRPAFDDDGHPVVQRQGESHANAGLTALYGLACLQVAQDGGGEHADCSRLRETARQQADWLIARLEAKGTTAFVGKAASVCLDLTSYPEAPGRVHAAAGLTLALLIAVDAYDGGAACANWASALAASLIAHFDDETLAAVAHADDPDRLPALMTDALALLQADAQRGSVETELPDSAEMRRIVLALADITLAHLQNINIATLARTRDFGPAGLFDEFYYVIAGLEAVGAHFGIAAYSRSARKMRRKMVRQRAVTFMTFQAPL